MSSAHLSAFDKMAGEKQEVLLNYLAMRYNWSIERAEREVRDLDHIGLAYINVEMKMERVTTHSSDYDPSASNWGVV